jgi:DNA modification methylase
MSRPPEKFQKNCAAMPARRHLESINPSSNGARDHVLRDLVVQQRAVTDLKPNPRNPRTHSATQIRWIAKSIRRFGWTNPILIDDEGRVLAGHGRVKAAKLLGLRRVPTIRIEGLSKAQIRAYVIADNKLAELAGWDTELLALELGELVKLDLDFDLTAIGFDTPELDLLLTSHGKSTPDSADDVPEPVQTSGPAVTQPGDLFLLGKNRILCGDALDPRSYRRLMERQRADVVFTDPPYNVRIAGHVSGLGRVRHREFMMASGEMSEAEFAGFLETAIRNLVAFSTDGSLHYIFMDWRHLSELVSAGRQAYTKLVNIAVWVKTSAGMGSLYRSQHEFVAIFKNGHRAHVNNVMLGRHGRHRSNVWMYPGANTFGAARAEMLTVHPTSKPIELIADALLDCSRRGDTVLDPFSGVGSTIIAAERTGRRAYALEIDPLYVDATLRRWQKITGEQPVHAATGLTFNDLSTRRCPSPTSRSNITPARGLTMPGVNSRVRRLPRRPSEGPTVRKKRKGHR